jgi:hypothetical protein
MLEKITSFYGELDRKLLYRETGDRSSEEIVTRRRRRENIEL